MTRILFLAVASVLAVACEAMACSVPVFRYALERWPADPYRLTVFHRGALTEGQKAVVDGVSRRADDGLVNVAVSLVNVEAAVPEAVAGVWKALGGVELPAVAVQYPAMSRADDVVEKGALTGAFMQQLLDSPVRREVSRRILQGDSVVWLLLESGDRRRDDEVCMLLKSESDRLAGELKIPAVDPEDSRTEGNVELKIVFSTIRLSRTDEAERFLVRLLVGIGSGFGEAAGPVIFPVFGRGRVLCGLAGGEISADSLEQVAVFLTGACSCEVKSMNPGMDLVVSADWDGQLNGQVVQDPELPPLVSLSQLAAEAKPVEQAALPPPAVKGGGRVLLRNILFVLGLGAIAVVAGVVALRNRDGRK